MSEDYSSTLAQYGGFDSSEFQALDQHVPSVVPEYNGGSLYAPVSYTPNSSNITGVSAYADPMDKHGADKLSAAVTRAQYADYQTRYQPLEDMAIGLITPTGTADGAYDVARAKQTVNSTFDSLQGQQNRSRERFGLQGVGDNISGSTTKASAMVGGINQAKMADQERREALLGGGSSTVAQVASGGSG